MTANRAILSVMKLTTNIRAGIQSMKTGEPPAGLADKARKAAYAYADEHGLSIEQVGVRATPFGSVKAFKIGEDAR